VRELGLPAGPVADAFLAVPREVFVPEWVDEIGLAKVYAPDAVLVTQRDANGMPTSSSSAPSIMSSMLVDLDVQPGQRVLEIGAGTGYNAALLATLVGRRGSVTSVELDPATATRARGALRRAGVRATVVVGDGHLGYAPGAPYDRIIATAASPTVPRPWFEQLADGGRVQLPYQRVGLGAVPTLVRRGDVLDTHSVVLGGFMSLRAAPADPGLQHDQVTASQIRDGRTTAHDALIGPPVARLSSVARRRLLHALVDEPSARRWRDVNPIGWLLLGGGAAQYAGTLGWGAAVIDRSGRRAAGVVRGTDGLAALHWGGDARDLLDAALTRWRRLGRPALEDLRLRVDFPNGDAARIRHSWRAPTRAR
jgi:protein-L-isoaspartate(D-aspartate) O-methyltransferase